MADITISERQAGDVTILDLVGKVTIGEGSVALRSAIRRLLGEGKKKILLNLAGVGYIDSSGIGELVSSFTAVNKEGGTLKLLKLTQKIQDLLAITKLLTVFDVFDDEGEEQLQLGFSRYSRHYLHKKRGCPRGRPLLVASFKERGESAVLCMHPRFARIHH